MPQLTPVPDLTDQPEVEESSTPSAKAPRRSGKILPTERISFPRQFEVLRAFAVAAADGGGAASNNAAGELIKMSHHTVVLSTPFFVSVGLLNRADRGRFSPVAEVIEYARAYEWQPATAAHRLAPVLAKSWFGQIITRMVSVQARDVQDVLTDLSMAAEATKDHAAQLEMLLEYAIAVGLVEREGRLIKRSAPGSRAEPEAETDPQPVPKATAPTTTQHTAPQPPASGMVTNFRQDDAEGVVAFDVHVRVKMSDFANWSPARISAFFGGIASVLAAKGRMEEDASRDS